MCLRPWHVQPTPDGRHARARGARLAPRWPPRPGPFRRPFGGESAFPLAGTATIAWADQGDRTKTLVGARSIGSRPGSKPLAKRPRAVGTAGGPLSQAFCRGLDPLGAQPEAVFCRPDPVDPALACVFCSLRPGRPRSRLRFLSLRPKRPLSQGAFEGGLDPGSPRHLRRRWGAGLGSCASPGRSPPLCRGRITSRRRAPRALRAEAAAGLRPASARR